MKVVGIFLLSYIIQLVSASTRNERVWPISGSNRVDLGQSSGFGPRLKASEIYRYDFHRGVDIPVPEGSPIYAIDDGKVKIAGEHSKYSDLIVQLEHTGWAESAGTKFYSNYIHMLDVTVNENQYVSKGDLIGHSSHSVSGFEHLHFEIRVGGRYQKNCCNPWKYLPNVDNHYCTFKADITLTPNPHGETCEVNVRVAVPPDQLTFSRIELHVDGTSAVYKYDMCEENLTHSFGEMDDEEFEDFLVISPERFSSRSYQDRDDAAYNFLFYGLPAVGGSISGSVMAVAYDFFGTSVSGTATYVC